MGTFVWRTERLDTAWRSYMVKWHTWHGHSEACTGSGVQALRQRSADSEAARAVHPFVMKEVGHKTRTVTAAICG
eukprot:scaffold280983_cov71-Attheya_sp.AAC.5